MDENEVKAMLAGKRKREETARATNFDDAWHMDVTLSVPAVITVHDHVDRQTTVAQVPLPPTFCTVRALTAGDEDALHAFAFSGLSEESRRLFAPYDWAASTTSLMAEFSQSIANSVSRRDLHLVALSNGKICCHAFLWAAHEEVPELGIAVADAFHGRGLGQQMLALLERVCIAEGKPAIELTTMQDNERAHMAYRKAGYEDLGIIRNPLGVDVAAAFAGDVVATSFSDEFHMVRILDEQARSAMLARRPAVRVEGAI